MVHRHDRTYLSVACIVLFLVINQKVTKRKPLICRASLAGFTNQVRGPWRSYVRVTCPCHGLIEARALAFIPCVRMIYINFCGTFQRGRPCSGSAPDLSQPDESMGISTTPSCLISSTLRRRATVHGAEQMSLTMAIAKLPTGPTRLAYLCASETTWCA